MNVINGEIKCELSKSCPNYFHPLCSLYKYYNDCKVIEKYHKKQEKLGIERRKKMSKLETI